MPNWLPVLAGASLVAASACTAPVASRADKGSAAAEPPRAAAPAPQPPVQVQGKPASDAIVLRDLLAVEALSQKLAAEIYEPEVGPLRSLVGGEKASQLKKAADTFEEVYEKELRRAAYRHGLTYEEARDRVNRHRGRPPSIRP